jgi:hypothetical protein
MIRLGIKTLERIEVVAHRHHRGQFPRQAWSRLGVTARVRGRPSRLAYTKPLADEKTATANCFLIRAAGWGERPSVTINRVMTDKRQRLQVLPYS